MHCSPKHFRMKHLDHCSFFACFALLCLWTTPVAAKGGGAMASAGSVELGLAGLLDLDKDDDTAVFLDMTLGYFIVDHFELGLTALVGTTETGERDTYGIFGDYDFENSTIFTPFTGIFFKHAAPPKDSEEKDAAIFGLEFGNKLKVADNVALATALVWEAANEPTFGAHGERKKRNQEINLSLRFYF